MIHPAYQKNLLRSKNGENAREQYQNRMYDLPKIREMFRDKTTIEYLPKTIARLNNFK